MLHQSAQVKLELDAQIFYDNPTSIPLLAYNVFGYVVRNLIIIYMKKAIMELTCFE